FIGSLKSCLFPPKTGRQTKSKRRNKTQERLISNQPTKQLLRFHLLLRRRRVSASDLTLLSMSSSSGRSVRTSISPFRSRKSPAQRPPPSAPSAATGPKRGGRPSTPPSVSSSSSSSRPPSRFSSSTTAVSQGPAPDRVDASRAKESVTVTVRFRPLSNRELGKGDEVAWYADGDHTVKNEYNPSIAYGFDRVFGSATTTRHVYDVAAQHVVSNAMQGVNGTIFAYGVTSSGKTHTMHGEQKSPGVIPLAVKDVFGIIQEMPGREFLLRVSYLEIYNEVINDLLDPTGQNLRIREDPQGTYVEGIKEEVVLSPAHALSLIATGEAHRHVGSNNINLLSSRSHTIFTLTIESSSSGETQGEEDVRLSRLHLIDLAGSESSKSETTGMRRKEGSYINKSLLTLGTVISKLTDSKATHVPFRDSKLTRLLQSSLSGHGMVSLICTVTPASSNSEETHNTLKFAHRSKHVEIKASQNKIIDEKSLIKKYQKEISTLKQELQELKRGMVETPRSASTTEEDLVHLKLQLEAGQVKLQSRLEEEEQAKEALMGRIQRLTKLILVSTKNSMQPSVPERPSHRRRHSFGEDELAYLPDRKRDYMVEDDAGSYASELSADGRDDIASLDDLVKDYRKSRRRGMLGWFKLKKPEYTVGSALSADTESSDSVSSASCTKSSQNRVTFSDTDGQRKSVSRKTDDTLVDSFPERTQAGELFSATVGGRHLPPTGTTITDQMDLLREQVKMLAGEVAFSTSSLKRLSEKVASHPEDFQLKDQMKKLKEEISEKRRQMQILEQRMLGSIGMTAPNSNEISEALSTVTSQLNEKMFELEIKSADNRILQEQLQLKLSENTELQETVLLLRQQLSSSSDKGSSLHQDAESYEESYFDESTPKSVMSMNRAFSHDESRLCNSSQAAQIENLKQEKLKLTEEKEGLENECQKLAEEASYAKELAAAAAVELRNLAEEVTKLSYQNSQLAAELSDTKEAFRRSTSSRGSLPLDWKQNASNGHRHDGRTTRKSDDGVLIEELRKELNVKSQREASLEAELSELGKAEAELRGMLDESNQHEQELENELSNMWVLVSKLRKSAPNTEDESITRRGENEFPLSNGHSHKSSQRDNSNSEALKANLEKERRRCKELERLVSMLKGEDIQNLDPSALEELQNFHLGAITKICHAKSATQDS
ncbi:Kinesin-like protein KIN-7E, chloroplastic, partial [Linum perenne]